MGKYLVGVVLSVVLVVGVLAAGIYRFNFTNDDLYLELEDARVVPLGAAGREAAAGEGPALVVTQDVNPVMLKLFSLQTSNAFAIHLPDSELLVPLSHFESLGGTEYGVADYRDVEMRGSVLLDYLHITPLNFESMDSQAASLVNGHGMAFVAPFIVTSQGSGSFWYLGMFSLNTRNATLVHLGSVFIGDRILLDSIEQEVPLTSPSRVSLHYRGRGPQQAMAETPKTAKTLTVLVSASGITLD